MTKINIQLFGGRGASSGIRATTGPSALEAFKENSNQLSKALREGKARRAAVVEFSDITGKVVKRYWDGSTYRDRPNSMYNSLSNKDMSGTFKSKFKEPQEWKKRPKKRPSSNN